MVQLRTARGFHDVIPSLNNVFKTNEKWFTDRYGNYFGLLPSGQVRPALPQAHQCRRPALSARASE